MPSDVHRQRFLPFRRKDIVEMRLREAGFADADAIGFEDIARRSAALLHADYHERLEILKDAYAPVDPDRDTRDIRAVDPADRARCHEQFAVELRRLLDDANFEEVTEADLTVAFETESLLDVRLHVDFDDFAEVAFFRRGDTVRTAEVRKFGGLRKRTIEFHNYDRVVMHVRFRDADHFEASGRKVEDLAFEPGSTLLKLFQNVPRPDLEMLFPNTEVRMRPVDKVLIGVPAVVSGVVVIATKLLASVGVIVVLLGVWLGLSDATVELDQAQLIGLGAGLGSAGGFLLRQLTKFKNRKIRFMKALTDNLYFKNLDNGAGVFHNLLDAAEEEQSKEVVLAYGFLVGRGPRTEATLDGEIEAWLAQAWQCPVDFEIADALAKLAHLELVTRVGCGDDAEWAALPLDDARRQLDRLWDDRFTLDPTLAPDPRR